MNICVSLKAGNFFTTWRL